MRGNLLAAATGLAEAAGVLAIAQNPEVAFSSLGEARPNRSVSFTCLEHRTLVDHAGQYLHQLLFVTLAVKEVVLEQESIFVTTGPRLELVTARQDLVHCGRGHNSLPRARTTASKAADSQPAICFRNSSPAFSSPRAAVNSSPAGWISSPMRLA